MLQGYNQNMPTRFVSRLRARCRACGFTLVELMVTLAVAAVLTMLAVPSFKHVLDSTQLSGVSNDLAGDLQYARIQAISRQTNVAIAASAGNWQNGWTVEVPPAATTGTPLPPEILRRHPAVSDNYVVSVDPAAASSVTYQSQGSLSGPIGTTACFTVYAPNGQNNVARFVSVLSPGMLQQAQGTSFPNCITPP